MEEFLFLDKANKDIGNEVYLDVQKILRIADTNNKESSLFNVLVLLFQDSGFEIRAAASIY